MEYKRKQRALSDATKRKISAALTGRKKSISHCQNISKGLENYWSQVPPITDDGDDNDGHTTMNDYIGV